MLRDRPFYALTTTGLEAISADELHALPGVSIASMAYRRIVGQCAHPLDALLSLRTVDDVFLTLANWSGIEHTRATLGRLRDLSQQLPSDVLTDAFCAHIQARGADQPGALNATPTFSVAASFVGARRYSAEEAKQALALGVAAGMGWRYQPDDRLADCNLRLFIEQSDALLGMRLGKTPLHERAYRRVHRPGALKPSIAAAMLRLAHVGPGKRLLDPCCGTGVIAIEAALAGADALGSDLDPCALDAARINAQAAGVSPGFVQMDTRALMIPSGSLDAIVSNLPWGRQVTVSGGLTQLYQQALTEMRRVLAPYGRLVLLTDQPDLARHPALRLIERYDISLFGRRPAILVFAE
ncbi:MAG TPA: methyltransferase domain-containing protein [Ktedonobacterales bacterium]|nr:methyltransferase domain-containing protein [Ktedonobacterales bacterium]